MKRVAVVGGGYAGLGAARELARRGLAVVVYERSGHLGGLAMTRPLGETEVEKYYHHWFTSDDEVLRVVRELGLGDRVLWIRPKMGLFCDGELYDFTTPGDLLAFRPFSMAAKARFAFVTAFLQTYPRREPFEAVTASSWLRRYAGKAVFDAVWGPLLRAKFGRNADRISMAWIWNKMRLRGRSRGRGGLDERLGTIEGGFGVVTRALGTEIERLGGEIRRAEPVRRIDREPSGAFRVESSRSAESFDGVVSTVAPPVLARLAPELPSSYRRRCDGFEHAAILCTHLLLARPLSHVYWMNVSDSEIPFGGLIEHTNFVSPETYGNRHLLYVSHYVYPDEEVFGLDGESLAARYEPGIRRVRPDFASDWILERRTFRDRHAQPIVTTDYHRRLLPLETPWPGLFSATMAQIYPEDRGTNYALRIGRLAAEAALERGSALGR